jgi:signal transduction histidine kinase
VTEERPQPTREQLAVCAHDLRGTLTVISGYVDLLRRDDLTHAERADALSGIEAAVGRADALIGDTLAGRVRSSVIAERVDVAIVARQAAADERAATNREVRLEIDGQPAVSGDAAALHRVFENLLVNAAKYAPVGPIELRVAEEGKRVVIEVADRGPGIPAEERERVLEPFARLERDIDAPGSGLGLTVVRSVTERMGGRVEVRERDGGGTVMHVELPAL